MNDLLKLLPIYGASFAAQIMFNYFNFTFLFSRLKFGTKTGVFSFTIPLIEKTYIFQNWPTLTVGAWCLGIIIYVPATLLVAWAYVLSVRNFDSITSAIIVGTLASLATSLFFARLRAGEIPNTNGWIAILLIILASFFAAHSSNNIKPL